MAALKKEPNATPDVLVDPDYENRTLDIAIEALDDILECDESCVLIKWNTIGGHRVPLLYILFSEVVAKTGNLPRIHIDETLQTWPAHAVCLASMPSGNLLHGDRLVSTIRRGVEQFLLQHNITRVTHRPTGDSVHA
jgi:hypothetical protein